MKTTETNFTPIVDLFAGPGGLGEGFSSLDDGFFRIVASAEMDPHAHETLWHRAAYRALKRAGEKGLRSYYDFCNRDIPLPHDDITLAAMREAKAEALNLTLGDPDDNAKLDKVLRSRGIGPKVPWVLIGGPPCQAYSLVGRARNRGNAGYRAKDDHRHYLYREYLRIIQQYRPTVFVMENVKGILSSSVDGERVFETILNDLTDPDRAVGLLRSKKGYRIHSLSHDIVFGRGDPECLDAHKFVVRSEEYGIPQARHRVILLGVREDIPAEAVRQLVRSAESPLTVDEVLKDLPRLRSGLSRAADSDEAWQGVVREHFQELAAAARRRGLRDLASALSANASALSGADGTGALRLVRGSRSSTLPSGLRDWYEDRNLSVWLNHEARGHMPADLMRYAYAATFAHVEKRSPKGHAEFDLIDKLHPDHANWKTGKFADRFRVQAGGDPATTVTSHISKDGHYFIHPDATQCRSLTVREAARLQTFPDNYFFRGNRTQQYHQVGNAVPPLLARKIAEVVRRILQWEMMRGVPTARLETAEFG
ncbi:modification methylase [Burkholderia vietnamiensis]|nr:modification methylase [Burkholderia vietnamiensis]